MSVLQKNWIIKDANLPTSMEQVLEKLISHRQHINIKQPPDFHDPFLFSDMEKAIHRINQAITSNERIIVFGDYDVDGISGTALLVHTLNQLNANVSYRLPHRVNDGYGLSNKFIDEFLDKQVKLIITVDCGISNRDVINYAHEKGIETIITDHHTIPAQPPDKAVAILHPKNADSKYPYSELTGSGVAFKLAQALIQKFLPDNKELLDSLTDLASLGTVADLGPLDGENRAIVSRGLKILANTKWAGLKKIMDLAKVNQQVDTTTIGYRIGPRINAAGRIGDPYIALSLLLQSEPSQKVDYLGQQLEDLNHKRKAMTEEALKQAQQNLDTSEHIIIAHNPDWHVGILGLVAGRLAERHAKPTIIMQDFGDHLVASARSPKHFNIIEAIATCSEFLPTFGGHAQAAGFTLPKEHLNIFSKRMGDYANKKLKDTNFKPTLEIDCHLTADYLSLDLVSQIDQLRPFGIGNKKPLFLLSNFEAQFIETVGHAKNHLKFQIKANDQTIKVIAFGFGQHADDLKRERKIDLACHVEKNTWKGRDYLQLHLLDFRPSVD